MSPATKYAPKCRRTGNAPYVRTKRSWGRDWSDIVYALTLAEAKAQFGWTRERHTTVSVRRATVDDLGLDYGWCVCIAGETCGESE